MSRAYFNEIDPRAAQWLRNLIAAGHIAPGDVDERSIEDVSPDDLRGYTQCHFFAGIGVWSYALRRAGWPDDRPVWTGSCPCQPFSASGKKGGFDDERHLWPAWHHLIRECRPPVVIGEQVASKDGLGWLDLVSADMEGEGYAVGASDLCAAGVGPGLLETLLGRRLVGEAEWAAAQETDPARESVWREFADYLGGLVFGAPHIRQRLYFVGVANAASEQHDRAGHGRARGRAEYPDSGNAGVLANTHDARPQGRRVGGHGAGERAAGSSGVDGRMADAAGRDARAERQQRGGQHGLQPEGDDAGRMADAARDGRREERADARGSDARDGAQGRAAGLVAGGDADRADPHEAGWHDPDWLFCRDGKWRPVEPGLEPLVDDAAARVGRLRGYGNAIVAPLAEQFIRAFKDSLQEIASLDRGDAGGQGPDDRGAPVLTVEEMLG